MKKGVKNGVHDARDLSGVQIDHSMGDLQEGNSYFNSTNLGHDYIMTFKDTSVLVNDEDEGAGDHNLLENIELQSSFKQRMHQRRR